VGTHILHVTFFSKREMVAIIPLCFLHVYMYACFQGIHLRNTFSSNQILTREMICRLSFSISASHRQCFAMPVITAVPQHANKIQCFLY